MRKKFKTSRASIAKPSHPRSLPPLGLSSQYQTIHATDPPLKSTSNKELSQSA